MIYFQVMQKFGYWVYAAVLPAWLNVAHAEVGGTPVELTDPLKGKTFATLVGDVIDGVITIATPILVIMVLVGGFQIMTAGGKSEQVESGRKTITYAVVGFAIILLAKGAVEIVKSILKVT